MNHESWSALKKFRVLKNNMVKRFIPPTRDQIIEAYGLPGDNRVARRLENKWRFVAKGNDADFETWHELTLRGEASKVWDAAFDYVRYELGLSMGISRAAVDRLDSEISLKRQELARQEFVDRLWGGKKETE